MYYNRKGKINLFKPSIQRDSMNGEIVEWVDCGAIEVIPIKNTQSLVKNNNLDIGGYKMVGIVLDNGSNWLQRGDRLGYDLYIDDIGYFKTYLILYLTEKCVSKYD